MQSLDLWYYRHEREIEGPPAGAATLAVRQHHAQGDHSGLCERELGRCESPGGVNGDRRLGVRVTATVAEFAPPPLARQVKWSVPLKSGAVV